MIKKYSKGIFFKTFGYAFVPVVLAAASASYAQWSSTESDAVSNTGNGAESSYRIKKGDTLWDLAFKFLGDPFRWPELWHANDYIKDPDRIYPGNMLAISATNKPVATAGNAPGRTESLTPVSPWEGETKQGVQSAQSAGESAIQKLSKQESAVDEQSSITDNSDSYITFDRFHNNFFTSDFLQQAGFLWFGKDAKGLIYPGNAVIVALSGEGGAGKTSKAVFCQFDEMPISVFGKQAYKIGDSLDVFHSYRFVKFKGKTANVVRRIGHALVTKASGKECKAVLYKAWDVVAAGDRIDTMAHFSTYEIDTFVDGEKPLRATVFERIEETESPYLFHTLLCDRGAGDGVRFGDIFLVFPQGISAPPRRPVGLCCVLHVGEQSSTLVIEKMFVNSLGAGDTLELVKRLRFK